MKQLLTISMLLIGFLNPNCQPLLDFQPITLSGPALVNPVDIANAGDGTGRLFIVEQRGTVRIVQNGAVLSTFFLDVRPGGILSTNEMGLLGLVFHPQFPTVPYIYVNYVKPGGSTGRYTRIARFEVKPDEPNNIDESTETVLMDVAQPYENHNAGDLCFGPDGYLYITMGDGGSGGDPQENGQDLGELLGKILRIDVDNGNPYGIPPDNPFVGVTGAEEEIWAWGMRNPWRISFDRETGDLWIADVGQGLWEEIDFEPAGSPGGINYGWDCYEGDADFEGTGCTDESDYEFPVFVYPHNCDEGCPYGTGNSVTGGFVYRGAQFPEMQGYYICVDYGSENIWLITHDGTNTEITMQSGSGFDRLSTFGEDENGELYAATLQEDMIFRVVPDGFLPVYLTDFDATLREQSVEIKWALENAGDVALFTLERSANGVYFKTLAEIPASEMSIYSYTDFAPESTINYYRLVTTLKDGAVQISPVKSVDLRKADRTATLLTLSGGRLGIQLHGVSEGAEVTIYTSDGRVVL
jgi:glucose/arabinose dehydrogenase